MDTREERRLIKDLKMLLEMRNLNEAYNQGDSKKYLADYLMDKIIAKTERLKIGFDDEEEWEIQHEQ
jgi:hypothetical protein